MRARAAVAAVAAIGVTAIAGFAGAASATTYRCTVDGRVTYSDAPCSGGAQRTIDLADPRVSSSDRAAAEARAGADRAALSRIDRERATELADDRRAAALAARRGTERSRQARACEKLARTARRAHDDAELAGPRDQAKDRLRMQRADQDFAALCKSHR